MLVRCPQCQYANQVEADATKPRIVCARCATVISIEFLSSPSVPVVSDQVVSDLPVSQLPDSDFLAGGRSPSEPSFMKTPESPLDLDSLLDPPTEAAPVQTIVSPPSVTPPVLEATLQPVESPWDDEILDIPRAAATEASSHDPLAVEDLLAATPVEPVTYESVAEPVLSENLEAPPPLEGFWGASASDSSATVEEPSAFVDEEQSEQFVDAGYTEEVVETPPSPPLERPSVFAQDSYTRSPSNTYVMATPDSENKGRLAKLFLAAALAFALLAVAYFALSGLVKDWLGARKNQQAAVTPGAVDPNAPNTAASAAAKTGAEANSKNASPAATASVAASTKPSTSPSAAATVASASPSAAAKPTATPAAAQTGTSGHAVGSGDGSLTIQLGAYKSSGEAQARVAKLKAAGIEGRVVKAEVPGKGTWFRVQSGRFTNESEASKHASELRAKGVAQDFIVTGYQNQ